MLRFAILLASVLVLHFSEGDSSLSKIPTFCSQMEVSDKALYPTFSRTKPTASQISKSVVSLLKTFNWNKITFIHTNEQEFQHTAESLQQKLEKNGIEVTSRQVYQGPYFHLHAENPFVKIVEETYIDTRIYVMLAPPYEFVGLLDHLQDRGLLDSGEYFVVGVYLKHYDPAKPQAFMKVLSPSDLKRANATFVGNLSDEVRKGIHDLGVFETKVTERSHQAFKYFMGIVHSPPVYPGYNKFTDLVNEYLEKPPFNFPNPLKQVGGKKILRTEAAYLYDAVWLYARAVHEILQNKTESIYDGRAVTEKIMGKTYKSAMGYFTRINEFGDAEGNYSVLMRKQIPTENSTWGLYPIGVFQLKDNTSALPDFKLLPSMSIDWPFEKPPVDEPACGYRGEKCRQPKSYRREIIGGVIGGLALVASIVGIFLYRNWKYEQALASLTWKIDTKDITFSEDFGCYSNPLAIHGKRNGTGRAGSNLSLASNVEYDLRHVFTHVGTYKGSIVAIRRMYKRHFELTRNIRKELKSMRDLRHDNINPFIGACVDPPLILIISAYCPKGSLQDILENEEIRLDEMFIASLVYDIIRGMIYLHDSEIKSHGKLKSSNCVVDSRLVLKITDFGLHECLAGAEESIGEHAYFQGMLWKAPELLRDPRAPPQGTQKGDVYSFAIIMYEIQGRRGPYGDITLDPKEIISRVKQGRSRDALYRPKLGALESTPKFVTECIKECWCEEPEPRPDFKTIRTKLKPMQKGMKPNIIDNMIAIMDKYATNLESLVEERTDQLIEEKKKTDELLHQMLPREVAEQLKRGKNVEAESFDCVTIYFSDICGFTALSSACTPMQIVDLLNDLYTLFDSIIGSYDVYKVETIGDAYMVVSGLPTTNGNIHAGEIASMSLHLLREIHKFRMAARPDSTLKLRIGIHSGPCVAGVVGLKMPRYCLFGDTVNTASRMESTGEPLKIHCSGACKSRLDQLGGYHIGERGVVNMKGKGDVLTFWLNGEDRKRTKAREIFPIRSDNVVGDTNRNYRSSPRIHRSFKAKKEYKDVTNDSHVLSNFRQNKSDKDAVKCSNHLSQSQPLADPHLPRQGSPELLNHLTHDTEIEMSPLLR